jgi:hypothetical protein
MDLTCSICNNVKDCSLFSKKKDSKRGYSYRCKSCHNDYVRSSWYPENKDKHASSTKRWKKDNFLQVKATAHNVDLKETKLKYDLCDGKCQICKMELPLCLDHCHTTNKVRGFLCSKCNLGIGYFLDDITLLESAIDYLQNA